MLEIASKSIPTQNATAPGAKTLTPVLGRGAPALAQAGYHRKQWSSPSAAYRRLSVLARCAYPELIALYRWQNDVSSRFPPKHLASRLNASEALADAGLRDLLDAGIIERIA
jgi:hypothetical protein